MHRPRAGHAGGRRGVAASEEERLRRWSLQRGAVTIPQTTKAARVDENLRVFDMAPLHEAELCALDALHENLRVSWDPTGVL